ncbi:cation transporter [Tenacibaculum piscium]|uniref:cation transporter n=2 Tax=Tenacibaculum piscium TaxID=1458515 RepID=UPI001F41D4CC|nr:heavy metal-associated domain-containing protein [Tenacibaculum piscium]
MMKIIKIVFVLAFVSFLTISCKNDTKKTETTQEQSIKTAPSDVKELSLNISGMTCEIGCAKKIASDLSKKKGVLEANVVFKDSVANIKYNEKTTNKADLIAFVEAIGNGKLYKASETSKKTCKTGDKKACASKCKKECEMACCDKNGTAKKECTSKCKEECKKECSAKTGEAKKECAAACEKKCCTKTTNEIKA